MDKASSLLSRLMLGLLFLLLALTAALTIYNGLESRSYLIALAVGALAAALCLRLKSSRVLSRQPGISAVKLGAALTALCLAVNLVWVLIIRIEPFSDYETYWQCACALAFGRPIASTEYIAMYPHILGYSSVLSLLLRVFGESVMAAAVLNVVLTAFSGLMIYMLCLRLLDIRCAAAAFLLWCFFPTKLMLNSLVFSEPLYTALILLFLLLVSELERRQETLSGRPLPALCWGLALGLLLRAINIVRPIAAILIIAYVIWLLLLRGRALKVRALWKLWLPVTAAMLCAYIVSAVPWDSHVEAVLGEEPASFPVYNIYVGFNEGTCGQWSAEDMDLLFEYRHQPGGSAGAAQQSILPHLKERLTSGIDFPRLFSGKLRAFLGDDELGGYTYRFTRPELFVKLCMVICNVYYYFVLSLVFAGLWRMGELRRAKAALLLPLYALGLTLAHMLVEVCNRYHYSLIPVFVIIAVFALLPRDENNTEIRNGEQI